MSTTPLTERFPSNKAALYKYPPVALYRLSQRYLSHMYPHVASIFRNYQWLQAVVIILYIHNLFYRDRERKDVVGRMGGFKTSEAVEVAVVRSHLLSEDAQDRTDCRDAPAVRLHAPPKTFHNSGATNEHRFASDMFYQLRHRNSFRRLLFDYELVRRPPALMLTIIRLPLAAVSVVNCTADKSVRIAWVSCARYRRACGVERTRADSDSDGVFR